MANSNKEQRTGGIYNLLERASVYSFTQRLVGSENLFRALVKEIASMKVESVLDLGCGPAEILKFLGDIDIKYYGCDINSAYLEQAKNRYGDKAVVFQHDFIHDGKHLHEKVPLCDVVIATGILHHLDDHAAKSLLSAGFSSLKVGGRLLSIENVLTERQNPIARWIIKHDRGRFVRTVEQYERLFKESGFATHAVVRTDLLRIPYTHLVTTAIKM